VFATAANAAPNGGCEEGTTANGVTTIPIEVFEGDGEAEALVNMCFAGKGPYPMVIDTGAEFSVISTQFAKELGLKPVGSPLGVEDAGCKTKARAYELEAHRSVGSNSKVAPSSRSKLLGKARRARWARSAPTSSAASVRSRSTSEGKP
jgi:hypothetical protein